ncbi:MAG: H(+)/Cl(-) exchange transporter ClcA, partial [Anaerolineaceae bacterium]|nr:H(+)/Cl(-) exchange transporter ClcA [Anaerolineaceae bacterium]
ALFRLVLAGGDIVRNGLITWGHQFPLLGWIFPVLFSIFGAVTSLALVRHFAPETSGSGIPHLKGVLHRFRTMRWTRILPTKFIAGTLALSGGLGLGREGPIVQMGGAVGDAIANRLKASPGERRTLIAAGAGAGLAAAFNAPLSGLTFVLEEVQRDFHPMVFAAAFIAAVIADIVARLLSGSSPIFLIPSYPTPPIASLPFFALLGCIAAPLGVLFNRGLISALDFFARFKGKSVLVAVAVVGAIIGMISWYSPSAVGGGHQLAEIVLAGKLSLVAIPMWFVLRFLLTTISYGTGTAGGIFAPLLVLGALVGLGIGLIAHQLVPSAVPEPAVFAVVGMGAYFTAIVRAPLTGILLIVEMTGNYEQMLPLLVSCFCAYIVAEWMKNMPIYEALLERDLLLNEPRIQFKEPMVVDFMVEPGAPFDQKEICSLGLPPGCVIVRCVEEGKEFVPTAKTRLVAHTKMTVFIAPEAANGFDALYQGCKSIKENGR